MANPFTKEEKEINDLIIEAHNKYLKLEPTHPSDIGEWVTSIHGLQNTLNGRVLRRDYPKTFYST